jgi:methionyl-tRNA formyltransferase
MQTVSFEMFKRIYPKLLTGDFKTTKQEDKGKLYDKHLDKELSYEMSVKDLYNRVRSLDFPPYEPAYFLKDNNKVYLKYEDIKHLNPYGDRIL